MKIWDFWAKRYNKLWVQKYSLEPTRKYIKSQLNLDKELKILDLGCGPGELIEDILKINPNVNISGLDYSQAMLDVSKKRNPSVRHIHLDVADLHRFNEEFDIIISSHSFPYWKDQRKVMEDLHNILRPNGKIIIGFASGETLYDKLVLFFVKFTTGFAKYPSEFEFSNLLGAHFEIRHKEIIKERKYMPRIAIYTLKRVKV